MPNWTSIAKTVADIVTAVAPIVSIAVPGAASAVHIGEKIIQGVIAAEPKAVALFNRIKNGAVPTADELQQFSDDYEASYQRLKANIASRLTTTPI